MVGGLGGDCESGGGAGESVDEYGMSPSRGAALKTGDRKASIEQGPGSGVPWVIEGSRADRKGS